MIILHYNYLRSWLQKLWFVWSRTSYSALQWRCQGGGTNKQTREGKCYLASWLLEGWVSQLARDQFNRKIYIGSHKSNYDHILTKLHSNSWLTSAMNTEKIDKVNSACVFASQTPGNIAFEVLLPLTFQKYSTCRVYLQLWPMLYLCICVFVFVYLQVRHPRTLFLMSSYHYLFKNIAHVTSICNFDQCCICVFVYLYLCICKSDTQEHCFWGPFTTTFSKI